MSIVGPRPHPIAFNEVYRQIVDEIKLRGLVKPGITGWAQVHGFRGDVLDFEENKKRTIRRIEHDIWYIENWSFWLDLQIIMLTAWQMIRGNTGGV
jgi:putative colanic acid biosysnthesis UDP-glucose lipid carrier transferase